jgi:hypothetical protein
VIPPSQSKLRQVRRRKNNESLYLFLNTKDDGPVVLDLPPAGNGSSLLGTIADAWQVPLTDVGFEGSGGKYWLLPPDYASELPSGYIPLWFRTVCALLSEHFACLTEKWLHITSPVSQLQRINEKVFIPPFHPSGVYCVGISRTLDRHRSLQEFFHGPIDDHSS